MSAITREYGIRRTEAGAQCEKCENDLSVEGSAVFVSHWDGIKECGYNFSCAKCGAILSQIFERSKEDAEMWGDEIEQQE